MKSRIFLLLVVLGLIAPKPEALGGGAAWAQDDTLNQARKAFDKGQDLFQDGKFVEAAEEFKKAHAARPFAQFLFNIGACYEKANDFAQALEFYQKYLDAKPADDDLDKTKARMKTLSEELEKQKAGGDPTQPSEAVKQLDKVEIRGLVVIESEPQGATIYLDSRESKPLAKTPWNGSLTGQRTVIIERKGYKSIERVIQPDPDKLLVLFFGLGEEDYLGYLDITSNVPGADIYIDDKSVGAKAKTPWSGEIKPGKHKIWVTKDGYDEHMQEVEVVAGETHKVKAELSGAEVGYLNIRGTGAEKAKVYVDGEMVCERAPCIKSLKPGKYKVKIKRDGYRSYTKKIEVQSKTEVTIRPKLAKEPGRTDAIVAYIFAAAFAGSGYYFMDKAKESRDELQAEIDAGTPPVDNNDPRFGLGYDTTRGQAWISNISYGLAGGSFLLGLYYTFRDKGKPSTGTSDIRAITLTPQVSDSYAGVGLTGSF